MTPPDAHALATVETVIGPPRRWRVLNLGELWEHRELVYFLTKRELQIRYKQSFVGVGWVILQPLALAFIFALFFGKVFQGSTGNIPYPVYAVVGLVPWIFTATAITNGSMSLVQDSDLISKVYFPRLSLPISKALSLIVDLGITLPVVVIIALIYGVEIQPTALLVLLFLALAVVTAFGLGTLFAAFNVKYRDVVQLVPMLTQIMFFATPILYTATQAGITGRWVYVYSLNPMVTVVEGMRWALFGTPLPGLGPIAVSVATSLLILLAALSYFRRTEQSFADVI